jgi:hypothetical protein
MDRISSVHFISQKGRENEETINVFPPSSAGHAQLNHSPPCSSVRRPIKAATKLPAKPRVKDPIIYLIFAFEDQDVGNSAERNAQVNDFGFSHVIRDVANVDDTRRFGRTSRFQFHLQIQRDRHYKNPKIKFTSDHFRQQDRPLCKRARENRYFLPAPRPPSVFIKLRRRWRDVPSCSGGKRARPKTPKAKCLHPPPPLSVPSAVVSSI